MQYATRITVPTPSRSKIKILKRYGFKEDKNIYVLKNYDIDAQNIFEARRIIRRMLKDFSNIDFEIGICPYQNYLT